MDFEGGMITVNVQVAEGVSQKGVPNRVRGNYMMLKHCGKFMLQHQCIKEASRK